MDVFQARRLAVDTVFGFTVAVEFTRELNLSRTCHCSVDVNVFAVGVFENESHFGKARRGVLRGSREDKIFHVGSAQMLGGLLTHDPEKCVYDVGFSTAVGAHDPGDTVVELDGRAVFERLKALDV